ncbi:hypothetical protein NZK35_09275 [Stieleria sp. ICT_E10.1]|uniref:hypothetical protein n=1 Tax=Stieleria sedimenti TaxID=2976331 RepID=UPI0021805DBF|nr:hypothetical protein [Stieleria sedimenti]MCS7466833.1 hypothetical protein [Stieleria sedimenti]
MAKKKTKKKTTLKPENTEDESASRIASEHLADDAEERQSTNAPNGATEMDDSLNDSDIEELVLQMVMEGAKPYAVVLAAVQVRFSQSLARANEIFGRLFVEWISNSTSEFQVFSSGGQVLVGIREPKSFTADTHPLIDHPSVAESASFATPQVAMAAAPVTVPRAAIAVAGCEPNESASLIFQRIVNNAMGFMRPLPISRARQLVESDICFRQKGRSFYSVLRELLLIETYQRVKHNGVTCLI